MALAKLNLSSPFYSGMNSWFKQNSTRDAANKDYQKLKDKYNSGDITEEEFNKSVNDLNTKYSVSLENDDRNIDKTIKNASTAYTKAISDADAKLKNKEISGEEYNDLVEQANTAYENETGAKYEVTQFNNNIGKNVEKAAEVVGGTAADALNVAFNGRPTVGVSPDGSSTGLRAQAQEDLRQAGDEQRNAQQNFQIANRNYRDEAGKDAAMKAAAQNAQTVNNATAGVGGGAAAMMRQVVTPDTQTYMNRQDTQRKEGVENQRQMHAAQQEAIRRNSNADNYDYVVDNAQRYNNAVGALSTNSTTNTNNNNAGNTDNTPATPDTKSETEEDTLIKAYSNLTKADIRNLINMIADERQQRPAFTYQVYPPESEVKSTDESRPAAEIFKQYPDYQNKLKNIYAALKNDAAQRPGILYKAAKDMAIPSDNIYNTQSYNQLDTLQLIQDFLVSGIERRTSNSGEDYLNDARAKNKVNTDPAAVQKVVDETLTNDKVSKLNNNVTNALSGINYIG